MFKYNFHIESQICQIAEILFFSRYVSIELDVPQYEVVDILEETCKYENFV